MGKSTSKFYRRTSKKFDPRQSIKKLNEISINNSQNPLDIISWLTTLDLREYEHNFKNFKNVEDLIYLCDADLKKLGIRNSAKRSRILANLDVLRDKYQKGNINEIKRNDTMRKSSRYSLAVKSSCTSTETYELLNKETQSKSLGDLYDMELSQDAQEALTLKKALEWELSLDSRDLRSHAWFHGPIPRNRAEEIVDKDGDFLIRDCVSQPGNFVLTCKTKGPILHFVINKILIQPSTVYERVQYQFEDDAYDTVADLITFYVGSGKSISAASGAKIQYPCNRMYPLSFYASKYGAQISGRGVSPLNSPSLTNAGLRYNPYKEQGNYNSYRSPISSPPRTKRETPPRLPSKKQRSHSLTPNQSSSQPSNRGGPEKYSSADGIIENQNGNNIMTRSADEKSVSSDGLVQSPSNQSMSRSSGDSSLGNKFTNNTTSKTVSGNVRQGISLSSRTSSLNRDYSDPSLSPCLEQRHFGDEDENDSLNPPPKPVRNNTVKEPNEQHGPIHRVTSYHASGSDSGNGSGDSAQSSATGDLLEQTQHRGVVIKNPKYLSNSASSVTLKSFAEIDPIAIEESLSEMEHVIFEQNSKYDLENFQTLLLPSIENKPLDNGALNTFRMMLSETGPRVIANHLTRVDINLILGDLDATKKKENILDCTGIELVTLDHGKQFRKDLIERTECLKLLVATTILTCQNDCERAETLNKWIQVAVDTKTALGNLFGFCSIMLGLSMPQIQKLESTWHVLRQKYTDSAFSFEAKLRPTLKNMNDCTNPQAPNTTIPHLLPYILLKDRSIDDILYLIPSTTSLIASAITPWETSAADFGLSILLAHLDSARNFIQNLPMYKRNAQSIMSDTSRLDELLEQAFRTEYHVKFLFGSKSSLLVSAENRHAKFEQVLTVMADKYCGDKI